MREISPRAKGALKALAAMSGAALLTLVILVTASRENPHGEKNPSFDDGNFRVTLSGRSLTGAPPSDGALLEKRQARIRFTVGESRGGRPLGGLKPIAWLVEREEGAPLPEREAARRAIQDLLAGRLARASAVNLNEYLLVTLDDAASLSIIDPQIDSAKTKTIGLVSLAGKGEDLAVSPDRRTAAVAIPVAGLVAFADVDTRFSRYADVGGAPVEVEFQPDGRYAWVGDRTSATVSVVDPAAAETVARIATVSGPHEFAFRDDGGVAYVAGAGSHRIAVVDARRHELVAMVDVGGSVAGIAWSARGRFLAAALSDGEIALIGGERHAVTGRLSIGPGLKAVSFSPDGRFGFVLRSGSDEVAIVDAATGLVSQRFLAESGPERVDFTESFAYVRHSGSEFLVLVDLSRLAEDPRPIVTRVPIGQKPPAAKDARARAPQIARLPEGGGALILNSADRSVYHYMEGMNAPMGSYPTFPWAARGIALVDRTIREVEKGVYEAVFLAPEAGSYVAYFLSPEAPQIFGALPLEVVGTARPRTGGPSLRLEPLYESAQITALADATVAIRLVDSAAGGALDGVEDVSFILYDGPRWSRRVAARGSGDGRYEATVRFPSAGKYTLQVSAASIGLRVGQFAPPFVEVGPAPQEPIRSRDGG